MTVLSQQLISSEEEEPLGDGWCTGGFMHERGPSRNKLHVPARVSIPVHFILRSNILCIIYVLYSEGGLCLYDGVCKLLGLPVYTP